jgi:hypothetical protein
MNGDDSPGVVVHDYCNVVDRVEILRCHGITPRIPPSRANRVDYHRRRYSSALHLIECVPREIPPTNLATRLLWRVGHVDLASRTAHGVACSSRWRLRLSEPWIEAPVAPPAGLIPWIRDETSWIASPAVP